MALHERTCSGPMPLRIADLPLASRLNAGAGTKGAGAGAVPESKNSVAAGASTAGQAAAKQAPGGAQAARSVAGGVHAARTAPAAATAPSVVANQKKHDHDKNRIGAIIDTYRDQIRRGQGTAAPTHAASKPTKSGGDAVNGGDSDSSVEIVDTVKPPAAARSGSLSGDKGGIKREGNSATKTNSTTNAGVEATTKAPTGSPSGKCIQKGPQEWTTVWTCDICQKEQFDCYEDAVAHEKICEANKKNRKKKDETKAQDPSPSMRRASSDMSLASSKSSGASSAIVTTLKKSPSPRKIPAENKEPVPLFSPVLRDASDSSNFSLISRYHRLILKSVVLLHRPTSSTEAGGAPGGGGVVSFQCKFCAKPFVPDAGGGKSQHWTLSTIAENLPSMVQTHTMSKQGCKFVTSEVAAQLPNAKAKGKMRLDEFLSGFFCENGIVERILGGGQRAVILLPEEEFRKMPGSGKSKRGMQLKNKKKRGRPFGGGKPGSATKRQKAGAESTTTASRSSHKEIKFGDMGCKMHMEEGGAQFCLGPLDGLPFLCSFLQEESKGLLTAQKLLLQQIELFTIYPKLLESEKLNAPPQSVGIRCRNCIANKNGCCFMKLSSANDISRDVLLMSTEHVVGCRFMKNRDVKVIQGVKEGGISPLVRYCNMISKLYCLKDSKVGSKVGVIWGDSPKTVSGGYCMPSDVKVNSLLVAPMPNLEAEPPTAEGATSGRGGASAGAAPSAALDGVEVGTATAATAKAAATPPAAATTAAATAARSRRATPPSQR